MSYRGPRDNGEGRPGDIHQPTILQSSSTTEIIEDASSSAEPPTGTITDSADRAPPTPLHLKPILQLLRGHRAHSTPDDRSRSPPLRDLNSPSANATSRRLSFYQRSAASLPVIENLSATMEQSIKDSLQTLSLNQARSHIQHILAEFQPFESESPVPLSTRLTTAVNNIRDPIQDN